MTYLHDAVQARHCEGCVRLVLPHHPLSSGDFLEGRCDDEVCTQQGTCMREVALIGEGLDLEWENHAWCKNWPQSRAPIVGAAGSLAGCGMLVFTEESCGPRLMQHVYAPGKRHL